MKGGLLEVRLKKDDKVLRHDIFKNFVCSYANDYFEKIKDFWFLPVDLQLDTSQKQTLSIENRLSFWNFNNGGMRFALTDCTDYSNPADIRNGYPQGNILVDDYVIGSSYYKASESSIDENKINITLYFDYTQANGTIGSLYFYQKPLAYQVIRTKKNLNCYRSLCVSNNTIFGFNRDTKKFVKFLSKTLLAVESQTALTDYDITSMCMIGNIVFGIKEYAPCSYYKIDLSDFNNPNILNTGDLYANLNENIQLGSNNSVYPNYITTDGTYLYILTSNNYILKYDTSFNFLEYYQRFSRYLQR